MSGTEPAELSRRTGHRATYLCNIINFFLMKFLGHNVLLRINVRSLSNITWRYRCVKENTAAASLQRNSTGDTVNPYAASKLSLYLRVHLLLLYRQLFFFQSVTRPPFSTLMTLFIIL